MEILPIILIFILLCLGITAVELRIISSRLNKIEDDMKRHNNIQSVILEQVDKIATNVGV